MRNRVLNFLWAFLVIAAGIGFIGAELGWWSFHLISGGWWAFFLIIPSFVCIIQRGPGVWSVLCLLGGLWIFLNRQDFVPQDTARHLFLPAILLCIGGVILFKVLRAPVSEVGHHKPMFLDLPNYFSLFSGKEAEFCNQPFYGANATAIFGGVDLDVRGALITGDTTINCSSVFGGITIKTDPGVNVKVNCLAIFGGTSDKRKQPYQAELPTIYVKGLCLFGGVDVK